MNRKKIIIHPNDGYDLGMMTDRYTVTMKDKSGDLAGEVLLKNECNTGTVILNLGFWEEIGKPKKIKLEYKDGNISFSPFN